MICLKRQMLGYPLTAQIQRLDQGVHVLITGGCRTHVGAISVGEPGEPVETRAFPGHRDQVVSEPWAAAIAEKAGERTVVLCGIHYDGIDAGQIRQVLEETDRMLREALNRL